MSLADRALAVDKIFYCFPIFILKNAIILDKN